MVPDSWERDDTLSGPPPVTPESVFLPGYRAHFFELEKGSNKKIAFHTPVGESFVIESSAPQFELVGNRLNDASEDKGPLFGGAAPRIRALEEQGWKNVGTIDIDEDGIAKKGWRTSFTPDSDGREQNLPSEFSDRNGGWYLLTFRDTEDNVIERLHFRFTRGLKEIKLVQPSPLPSGDGHAPVSVEFLHEPGFDVQPVDFSISIQIERQGEKTTLTIPPNPKYDETGWSVGPVGGPQVEVTILVERLWWGIGEEHNVPSEWKDKALTLAREDFAATSNKALWLRLPRLRWVNKVLVGFGLQKARSYFIKVTDKTIAIPLRDFGDFQEVQGIGITPLKLWIFAEGTTAYEGIVCKLKINLRCKLCDFETFSEEDVLSHVGSFHLSNFIRPLTYEELSGRIPSLPHTIYQCGYCNYYVESNDIVSPTSAIWNHIEQHCTKASRGMGPPQIRFRVIHELNEIRENVIHNLPYIYKCNLCNDVLENPTKSDMINHLIRSHRNKLYESR
jgi:hypothetical protein